jgi:hypothetical protein
MYTLCIVSIIDDFIIIKDTYCSICLNNKVKLGQNY